ncbi:MAG: transcription elongation factor GreA [Clostridia bacterium]|nr:transcription elongation factor GreA [Clostridia bacterium]
MSEKVILTEEAYQELQKRLDELKFVKRPEITERIKVARDFGDLSENAEYDAAKNEQARIEGEIVEIEQKLKAAEIIKSSKDKGVVSVGMKVTVLDLETQEEDTYEIVGTTEASISEGRISNECPLGKALVGAKVGSTVTVLTPSKEDEYQVTVLAVK